MGCLTHLLLRDVSYLDMHLLFYLLITFHGFGASGTNPGSPGYATAKRRCLGSDDMQHVIHHDVRHLTWTLFRSFGRTSHRLNVNSSNAGLKDIKIPPQHGIYRCQQH